MDISDLAGVARIARGKAALRPQDRGEGSIEVVKFLMNSEKMLFVS